MFARLDRLDRRASARVSSLLAGEQRRRVAGVVGRFSQTGSYGVGWMVLFLLVAGTQVGARAAVVATACVASTLVLNTAVKLVVRRSRPEGPILHQPTSHSFPSAHTSMAVVGAAIMTHLVPGLGAVWWAFAALLGVSRVALGVHYLGDVVAGAVFGAALAPLAVSLVIAAGG